MTTIAFIGLGNMGSGMAANQAKAGRNVRAFDLSSAAMDAARAQGMTAAASAADAVKEVDVVITMLPAGKHVRDVYEQAILPNAPPLVLAPAPAGSAAAQTACRPPRCPTAETAAGLV